jgi:hypothetical protein
MASEDITYDVQSFKSAFTGSTLNISSKSSKSTVLANELDKYVSYNAIWTLSALNKEELRDSKLITKGRPHDIIAKSGGIGPDGNFSTFNSDASINKTKNKEINADTILRRGHDIFFEKVVIDATNSPNAQRKMMNFNKIEIEMTEPFGVTLFEKLRAAAFNCGFRDHADAPFLLTLDFKGYNDKGSIETGITTRYLPIKITNAEMNIDQGGTRYSLIAVPWTEFAMTDRFLYTRGAGGGLIKETIAKITAPTARDVTLQGALNRLANILNEQQNIEIAKKIREKKDIYVIKCDKLGSLTANSSANWNLNSKDTNFKVTVRPNMSIAKLITDLIISSDGYRNIEKIVDKYWKDLAATQSSKENQMESTGEEEAPDPMVPWFKIKTSIYLNDGGDPDGNNEIGGWDSIRKMDSKIVIFEVVPYKVHVMNFTVPGLSASKLWGKTVKKAYKYIYTGENTQIMDLKINYKYGYFQARLLDGSRAEAASKKTVKDLSLSEKVLRYGNKSLDFPETLLPLRSEPTTLKSEDGATEDGAPRTMADEFFEYITNPLADMVNVEMTILGDPAFIGQECYLPLEAKKTATAGGTGQQIEQVAQFGNKQWDDQLGCFNYDESEAFVTLNFRFPTDINEKKGVMDFQSLEDTQFSGLYKVVRVESVFDGGKFLQTLHMVRYNNQGKEINVVDALKQIDNMKEAQDTGSTWNIDYSINGTGGPSA